MDFIQATQISEKMTEYLLSLSICKHGSKPSCCASCNIPKRTLWHRFREECSLSLSDPNLWEYYSQWKADLMARIIKSSAKGNVRMFQGQGGKFVEIPSNQLAYGKRNSPEISDSRCTVAQSVSKRPLRVGGDDRVLSDQVKYGSRADRASQKHHEINNQGQRELRKYYGHNERVYK